MKQFRILIIVTIILLPKIVCGQIKPRVEGLASDQNYMELLSQQEKLKLKQDSIVTLINDYRKLAEKEDEKKKEYTNEVLKLENQLFDIRSELGNLTAKTNIIEQEFIASNMSNSGSTNNGDTKNLIESKFIKDNTSKEELAILRSSKKAEDQIQNNKSEIQNEYNILNNIIKQYSEQGDVVLADSLRLLYDNSLNKLQNMSSETIKLWDEVFQYKFDIYNRLLDKIGVMPAITTALYDNSKEVRSSQSDMNGVYMFPELAIFPAQRNLVLKYEKELAVQLKLNQAKDSIDKELAKKVDVSFDMAYPKLPELDFITYKKISTVQKEAHNASNPPSELKVPSRGSLYKIELGSFAKELTTFSSLRYVSPVEFAVTADGKYRYFAGSYKTEEEAKEASSRLNKLGMKTTIATWINGENSVNPELSISQYYIEMPFYTTVIKNILESDAPYAMLTKNSTENGDTYRIGPFKTRGIAEAIATKIGEEAKVVK